MHTKTRENRLRLAAQRQGLKLVRSRRRDPRAIGHGRYCLTDRWNAGRVVGAVPGSGIGLIDAPASRGGVERFACWVSLDVIERWLMDGMKRPGQQAPVQALIPHDDATRQDAQATLGS